MFKELSKILELQVLELEKKLEILAKSIEKEEIKKQYNSETGERFINIINNYPISEEQLLSISETVAKFVAITRITNIDRYLFTDKELTIPRIIY